MVRIFLVKIINYAVTGILGSNWHQLATEISKGSQILNLIRILLADNQANHTGTNIVLRENILFLPRLCNPDTLGAYSIFARFNTNQQIIIRGRHKFEIILRQFLGHFLHYSHLKAIRLSLFINKIIRHIIVGVGNGYNLFATVTSLISRFVLAATASSYCQCSCQNTCYQKLADFLDIHRKSSIHLPLSSCLPSFIHSLSLGLYYALYSSKASRTHWKCSR